MKTLVALLVMSSVASAQPHNPCGGPPMPPQRAPQKPRDTSKVFAIKIDAADAVDGAADAKVTIVDTYDYACPYCDKVRPTIDALKAKYGKDLRIVYKPFVVHMTTAMAPAISACAANRQHKFAEMDAALWDNWKAQKLDKDASCWKAKGGCANADAAAAAVKLDMPQYARDLNNCENYVKMSMGDMQTFGVNAIPTFYINGRVLMGAQPQASFEAIIDEELKKAESRLSGAKSGRYYQQWVVEKGEKGTVPRPANPCGDLQIVKPPRGNPCGGKMAPPLNINPCGG